VIHCLRVQVHVEQINIDLILRLNAVQFVTGIKKVVNENLCNSFNNNAHVINNRTPRHPDAWKGQQLLKKSSHIENLRKSSKSLINNLMANTLPPKAAVDKSVRSPPPIVLKPNFEAITYVDAPEPETIIQRNITDDTKPDFLDLLNESMESFSLMVDDTSSNSQVVLATSGDAESVLKAFSKKKNKKRKAKRDIKDSINSD